MSLFKINLKNILNKPMLKIFKKKIKINNKTNKLLKHHKLIN